MTDVSAPPQPTDIYWRSMRYISFYRLLIAAILLGSYFLMYDRDWWQYYDRPLYFRFALGYLAFSTAASLLSRLRQPRFEYQLTVQATGDIVCIIMLMHAAGGVQSGLGLLLVVAIAGTGMISQGRQALFYAALASIALLLEQSWQMLGGSNRYDNYTQSVMLSLSCFATAWLAHTLAKRTRQSEELASKRGSDLENLSEVNQLIIQDMQDGVLVVDKDFRLRHHNRRSSSLLGLDASLLSNNTLEKCAPEIAAMLQGWLDDGQKNRPGAARLMSEGKELRLRFFPVGADLHQGTVIFIEDWDRVQSQARQLKLASLGGLTANIAHEIRNPLSAISHANQLLQEEDNLDPTFRRLLRIVDDNVHRLDKIVQDVMQLNHRDRIQQEDIHLAGFAQEFCDQFCLTEHIPPAGLNLDIADGKASALFDRHQLHQVLWNLCRNGWRHGRHQNGSLTLHLGKAMRKGEIMLEIADDGAGVAPEVRPRLFEPFFTTEKTGTGLGLYIARELCEANGATLRFIESTGGARFRIYLKNQHA